MSSKTHLPPRCPRLGNTFTRPASSSSTKDAAFYNLHQKSDQGIPKLEQKPARVNSLGTDSNPSQNGTISLNSAIDSVSDHESLSCIGTVPGLESTCTYGPNSPKSKDELTSPKTSVAVSDGVVSSRALSSVNNDHESLSCIGTVPSLEATCTYGPNSPKSKDGLSSPKTALPLSDDVVSSLALSSVNNDHENLSCIGTFAGLESTSTYGPNSPKSKEGLSSPETAMSEISKYFSQDTFRNSDDGLLITEMLQCDLVQDGSNSVGETSSETARRRHNRERARNHKPQYIAALERSVDGLQRLGADLFLRVSCLLEQQAVLSYENNNLKQQISIVEQAKLIADGEYEWLKCQEEQLKSRLDFSYDGRCNQPGDIWLSSGDKLGISSEATAAAALPDMRKLDIR